MKRILFVCHGNICRSPMAESVFAEKVRARKLEWAYDVDSAAVSSEEIGNPVHPGTQRELARHGLPRSAHRARQLRAEDYAQYDCLSAWTEIICDAWSVSSAAIRSIKLRC